MRRVAGSNAAAGRTRRHWEPSSPCSPRPGHERKEAGGGVRVIVTRPEGQEEPLASRLRGLGHEVVLSPLTRIEPLGDGPIELGNYDWLLVTSVNGAAELARRARGRPHNVAAIGPGTAAALEQHGIRVDLVPDVSTQEGLLAELPRPTGRGPFAGAEGPRRLLVDDL